MLSSDRKFKSLFLESNDYVSIITENLYNGGH